MGARRLIVQNGFYRIYQNVILFLDKQTVMTGAKQQQRAKIFFFIFSPPFS